MQERPHENNPKISQANENHTQQAAGGVVKHDRVSEKFVLRVLSLRETRAGHQDRLGEDGHSQSGEALLQQVVRRQVPQKPWRK